MRISYAHTVTVVENFRVFCIIQKINRETVDDT
ncbi:hypothetical protein GGQ73_004345 [Rhizobium skierniewicense]|uniref:Uncharacterized protein n=1 Tax=Rhizobium skierniewicense TaxID=984260 RepID=A0A7W6G480_9HYPH|nr:hypothetical protein [Rhizobium skierniewicense]